MPQAGLRYRLWRQIETPSQEKGLGEDLIWDVNAMAKTPDLSPLPLRQESGESPRSRYLLPSAKAFAAAPRDLPSDEVRDRNWASRGGGAANFH